MSVSEDLFGRKSADKFAGKTVDEMLALGLRPEPWEPERFSGEISAEGWIIHYSQSVRRWFDPGMQQVQAYESGDISFRAYLGGIEFCNCLFKELKLGPSNPFTPRTGDTFSEGLQALLEAISGRDSLDRPEVRAFARILIKARGVNKRGMPHNLWSALRDDSFGKIVLEGMYFTKVDPPCTKFQSAVSDSTSKTDT